jgi:SAM-dependent methyltransferase
VRKSVRNLADRFYYGRPEWIDGSSQFSALVRECLRPEFRILDLGAGSGKCGPINFQGEVRTVVGIDPDPYIKGNSRVDHGVMGSAQELPFSDDAFDLVLSDWVVEHLADPQAVAREVYRVVKPGGYFVFRTGNVRHYSYAIATATPHWFHTLVANRVRGLSGHNGDPHPTYFRMNTQSAVRECLTGAGFAEDRIMMVEPEPSYLMFSVPSLLAGLCYERIVNRAPALAGLRACIFARFRKPAAARSSTRAEGPARNSQALAANE